VRLTRKKRAAVLGCGPAGLFAAHGLIRNGWDVQIYSKKRPSRLFGAQYLHAPIDFLSPMDEEPTQIDYRLEGTVEGYREKVYGPNAPHIMVSPQSLVGQHHAWDIRAAYEYAWKLYEGLVTDVVMLPQMLAEPLVSDVSVHLVVNSIPARSMCLRPDSHQFHSTQVWAMGDAPEFGQTVPIEVERDTVVCNGSRDTGWYRASNVFGHKTVEWPGGRKPPLPGVAAVEKPLYKSCDCWTRPGDLPRGTRYLAVGRYGAWSKNILSHHAYEMAVAQ
jgi:hypothetical protein